MDTLRSRVTLTLDLVDADDYHILVASPLLDVLFVCPRTLSLHVS